MNKTLTLAAAALIAVTACTGKGYTPSDEERKECLEFLQTYLPMPDTADNSIEFFEANIDAALRARAEMPWGADVPDREWRHFVLPMRVNNEWLDSCRPIFYSELKPRVQGLSMKDAILEVNHWCHEKATYQPSDGRTHSPLMTVYTHLGRCGEESTFTVAALRSVGIPARQVYTPRWAHTDDNHAWVEAWADGQWWFLGACEPEPVLNLGWFNSAAARGVLMNTRVIGANYDGPEEVLLRTDQYVDINVTSNYAPVDTLWVEVIGADGKPAADAEVSFRLYNYGEFCQIAAKKTDEAGRAYLIAGLGDIVVWASDASGAMAYEKSRPGTGTLTLTLSDNPQPMELKLVPPVPGGSTPDVTEEQAAENERRKAYEDSLRTAVPFRHAVLDDFVASVPEADRERAKALIASISDKDRRDVTMEVLRDHFTAPVIDSPLYTEYILCPRVATEELSPYRQFFAETLCASDSADLFRADPSLWAEWVRTNIDGSLRWYPSSVTVHPATMWKVRKGNARSRDIFFVAGARSLGIPARIDPVTSQTQWADNLGRWTTVNFDPESTETSDNTRQGRLKLTYNKTGRIDDPKYYVNFTLSRIDADGTPMLLEYPEDATWSQIFQDGADLDAGRYMLVTGQRLADGTVLARTSFIDVDPAALVSAPLVISQDSSSVQVIGSFNAENLYKPADGSASRSLLSTAGRGYYVVGLISPNHEPSAHALNDLIAEAPELEKWGRSIILLFDSEDALGRFDADRFKGLPTNVTFGTDIDGAIAAELTEGMKLNPTDRPVIAVVDSFNRVLFIIQGYNIGLGHRLLQVTEKL